MGTFLGVPIIRTIVFWGLYWGPPNLGNYQIIFPILISRLIEVPYHTLKRDLGP